MRTERVWGVVASAITSSLEYMPRHRPIQSLPLPHDLERPPPAGVCGEMGQVAEEDAGLFREGRIAVLFGRVDGPVDKERPAHEVLALYEAPVAAVERVGAVVTHHEVAVERDHQVVAVDVLRQLETPPSG